MVTFKDSYLSCGCSVVSSHGVHHCDMSPESRPATEMLLSAHSFDTCLWESPIIPLLVHQAAYPSIWPAALSLQSGLSTNPGVTMWCVCGF